MIQATGIRSQLYLHGLTEDQAQMDLIKQNANKIYDEMIDFEIDHHHISCSKQHVRVILESLL